MRLAGPVADRLWFPSSGYRRTPQPVEPAGFPSLSRAAAAELRELEQAGNRTEPGAFVHDEDAALHYAFVLVGRHLSLPYYQWAEADTRALVAENSRPITRLAKALMERHALSARGARAVVRTPAAWRAGTPFPEPGPRSAWFAEGRSPRYGEPWPSNTRHRRDRYEPLWPASTTQP